MIELRRLLTDIKLRAGSGDALASQIFRELKNNDVEAAQKRLADAAAIQEAEGEIERRRAAQTYRELGALTFFTDTKAAIDAYRHATKFEPENPELWNQLGLLFFRVGTSGQPALPGRTS